MRRWWQIAAGFVVVVVVVPGCGPGWRSIEIEEAHSNGLRIIAGSHCHPEARLRVRESSDQVVVTLQVKGERRGDCAEQEQASLRDVVGDRRLIDGSTGRPVGAERRQESSTSIPSAPVAPTCLDTASSPECLSGRR